MCRQETRKLKKMPPCYRAYRGPVFSIILFCLCLQIFIEPFAFSHAFDSMCSTVMCQRLARPNIYLQTGVASELRVRFKVTF